MTIKANILSIKKYGCELCLYLQSLHHIKHRQNQNDNKNKTAFTLIAKVGGFFVRKIQ